MPYEFRDDGERWKPHPDWDGVYMVSNRGRVFRMPSFGSPSGRLVNPHRRELDGYLSVSLTHARMGRPPITRLVHQLVLETWVGPRPEGMVTRHLDGSRSNNRVENLAYGTAVENYADAVKHGTLPAPKEVPVDLLGKVKDIEIARQYGLSRERVRQLRAKHGIPKYSRALAH